MEPCTSLNYFTAHPIDRAHDRQEDPTWVNRRLEDPTTRFILVWQFKQLFSRTAPPKPLFLHRDQIGPLLPQAESVVYLGEAHDQGYFAVGLSPTIDLAPLRLDQEGDFADLRGVGALIDRWEGALLAYARAMTYWHQQNHFCSACGSPTVSSTGGHRRICSNPQCGQEHFPRTDPAIIVLVTRGASCLLGRQASWAPGRYSTIAGFVEPGESLEDAVIREVEEETGVNVEAVTYCSSQPWPFPSSLMIGFNAQAITDAIHLNDGELEDARWFSREEIQNGLEAGTFQLPSSVSISYRLIEAWFDQENVGALSRILSALQK